MKNTKRIKRSDNSNARIIPWIWKLALICISLYIVFGLFAIMEIGTGGLGFSAASGEVPQYSGLITGDSTASHWFVHGGTDLDGAKSESDIQKSIHKMRQNNPFWFGLDWV